MKAEAAKIWVKALRSGRYEQWRGQLRRGEMFCAIGVLCDAVKPEGWAKNGFGVWAHDGQQTALSVSFATELGMKPGQAGMLMYHPDIAGMSIADMNDRQARSFENIAAIIEANWEKI